MLNRQKAEKQRVLTELLPKKMEGKSKNRCFFLFILQKSLYREEVILVEAKGSNPNKPVELVATGANQPPPAELKEKVRERIERDGWNYSPTGVGDHYIGGWR
jgi:hypothetical protein